MEHKTCKCGTCGYEWVWGKDGSHYCPEYLQKQIDELKEEIRAKDKLLNAIHECTD